MLQTQPTSSRWMPRQLPKRHRVEFRRRSESPKKFWQPLQLQRLRELYPHNPTRDLVDPCEHSLHSIYRKAAELRIRKSPEFIAMRVGGGERQMYNGALMTQQQIEKRRMYNREKMRIRRGHEVAVRHRTGDECALCHKQKAELETDRLVPTDSGYLAVKVKWCGRC
jgi:hypothetical protein